MNSRTATLASGAAPIVWAGLGAIILVAALDAWGPLEGGQAYAQAIAGLCSLGAAGVAGGAYAVGLRHKGRAAPTSDEMSARLRAAPVEVG